MPPFEPIAKCLLKLADETGAYKAVQEATEGALSRMSTHAAAAVKTEAPEIFFPSLETFTNLRDPRCLSVKKLDFTAIEASLKEEKAWLKTGKKDPRTQNAVYLDGKRVGQFDAGGGIKREEFPLDIDVAHLTLSNSQTFSVPARDLSVISKWHFNGLRNIPEKRSILNSAPLRVTEHAKVGFDDILGLDTRTKLIAEFPFQRRGNFLTNGVTRYPLDLADTTLSWKGIQQRTWHTFIDKLEGQFDSYKRLPGWVRMRNGEPYFNVNADLRSLLANERKGPKRAEYPFQWIGDSLTNGEISLPKERPFGATAWNKLPIPAVPKEYWEPYLRSLEGKYLNTLLPNLERFLEKNQHKFRGPRLSPFQEEIKTVLTKARDKELWAGNHETAPGIALGHGVMFTQPLKNGESIFVLEQADRAVYLFKQQRDAEQIATGEWLRTNARKEGHRFVVHAGDWKSKLEKQLRSMAQEIIGNPVKKAS